MGVFVFVFKCICVFVYFCKSLAMLWPICALWVAGQCIGVFVFVFQCICVFVFMFLYLCICIYVFVSVYLDLCNSLVAVWPSSALWVAGEHGTLQHWT